MPMEITLKTLNTSNREKKIEEGHEGRKKTI
jgi:hypothetical protein